MENNDYISHHGIKGQRWGVEHGPPYPVRRGSGGKPKTTSVIKSRLKAALNERAEARKSKKSDQEKRISELKERKAQKAAEKHVEDYEKLRKKVINNPKELYKNKNRFSKKEIEDLIKEIEFDRKIKDVRDAEIKRGIESYRNFQQAFNTTAQLAINAKQIYNVAAGTYNMLIDSGKVNGKKWTLISDQPAKKKGNNKEDNNKEDNDDG